MPTWLLILLSGYFLFLAGFSLFMHVEGKKAGENQHRIKLLPPPIGWNSEVVPALAVVWIHPTLETQAPKVEVESDRLIEKVENQPKPATYSDSALA